VDTTLHIPWTNEALQALLLEVVKTGESTKVDFKRTCELSTAAQKAELARDIQAMANWMDHAYQNYGFLVLGAKAGELTFTSFVQDVDSMQATIDQIVREHIGPFVQTHVRHYENEGKTWGRVRGADSAIHEGKQVST
jgi:schlafen family protein